MDFKDEKLSIITILFITGISSLAFSGSMKLLEGNAHPLFLRAGIITLSLALILYLFKHIILYLSARKKETGQGRSAGLRHE